MLRVSLLGAQVVTDDATGIVRTRSSRTVALIALLVVHAGSPLTRQRIAGLFWPDSTDRQALTNLRRELHHLRQVLHDDQSLVVTSTDLCWRDTATCRVDVRAFVTERAAALDAAASGHDQGIVEHATCAVDQYQGELLPGQYDDWLVDARSELERQCVDLCDQLAVTRARTGDLRGAVEAARRRIRLQPLEEVGYRTLMQLQADLGDRAGAVSTYHHCASVLERELGVDPDQATRNTLQGLLAQASGPEPVLRTESDVRSRPATATLVGRSRELGALQSLWRTAAAGRPSLALVCGDAGVGKTRLVAEIAELARLEGAVVASAQCFGTAGRLALAPVAEWLRGPAVQSATARLDAVWRAEVDRLIPAGTRSGESRTGSTRAMVDAWQRHRFFEGLARALIGVGAPMLLVLDNVQWCDEETLAFVTFCLGLTTDAPLMVVGTLRDDDLERESVVGDWTARMRATGMLAEVALRPLEAADTARLAEATSGRSVREEDTDLLQATTGGFPLYVVEAARTTVDVGAAPPVGDLTAVLRNRLEQASPAARAVAGMAAAVGRNFTLDLLTEASDLEADNVVGAVDELWRRRIVHELRDGYDFSHDLLRDAAYAQISPPQRWLLHRRVAQALELLHGDDADTVSAQLAEQYARGGRAERALAFYRRAADVATARFAHAEAIRLHTEALDVVRTLPEGRDRDRRELAVLEAMAAPLTARHGYASPRLQRALERAIALAEQLGRKDATLTGLVSLWSSRFVQGRTADSYRTVTRALGMVEPGSELSGPAHFGIGGSAVSLGRPAEALRHFDLSAAQTSGAHSLSVGTRPDVHGMAWAAHAHWLLGHDDEALSSCRGAIALARTIDHPYSLAVALAYAGITHRMRQDVPAMSDSVGELRALCDRHDFAYYRDWALVLAGSALADEAGTGLARRGIDNLKAAGAFARMPFWLSLLAERLASGGRTGAARASLDAALVDGQTRDDMWWLPEVTRMRAAYDGPQAAVARLRGAAEMASAQGSVALLRRCERDLEHYGVRTVRPVP